MAVILVLGVSAALIGSLSTAGLKIKRDEKTTIALAQAKEALIGKSILYENYPGSLPCPDLDNDGDSDSIGGSPNDQCPKYIGRLPWKTLGIADLRDATGERLWYTLSSNVRRYDSVMPLNSDTQGTLNVTGNSSGNNLIAIVFAPGAPVGTQNRSSSSATCSTTGSSIAGNLCAANYLEGTNDDPSPGSSPNTAYQSSDASIDFNDQLITISHEQLFSKVEQRVGGEFRRHLNNYFASWGAYPFADPFSDPSTANFRGTVSTYEGLYPFGGLIFVNPVDSSTHSIGTPPPTPEWSSFPSPNITFDSGFTPSFTCEIRDYNGKNNSRVRCTANFSYATLPAGATVTMTAKLKNVGRGFWKPFSLDVKNIGVFDDNDEQVRVRDKDGNYVFASSIFDSVSVTGKLNYSDGSATVVFTAKGKQPSGSKFERIDLRGILYESNSLPYWIESNQWHRLLYYAVSPGNAPYGSGGASSTCILQPGTPSCLTVSGASSGSDRKAVVIMTGQALSSSTHPSGSLGAYLEGGNVSTGDFTFENKPASASFNDQVIVVAP